MIYLESKSHDPYFNLALEEYVFEKLDQNEEYAIISSNTSYGLSRYDHIVRNADKVSEQEILY